MENLSLYRVVLGDSFLNDTHEPYEQIVYIERIILHERYHGGLLHLETLNDYMKKLSPVKLTPLFSIDRWADNLLTENIAVVKVTPQIKFSNRVTSINLPSCEEEVPVVKAEGK